MKSKRIALPAVAKCVNDSLDDFLDVPFKHPMEIIEIDVLQIYVCESYVARYEHKYTFPNILMS